MSAFARRYLRNLFDFFSSGYLDVSVHQVPSITLCIQINVTGHYSSRVSPFGYFRIIALVQLPGTFRRLRVLHRHFIPRHSSHTLRSLIICSFFYNNTFDACSTIRYATVKVLSLFSPASITRRWQREVIPEGIRRVKGVGHFF